jgi:hypothetical protein
LDVALWVWAATIAAILALIALDFVTVSRNPHEVTLREAGIWSAIYIGVALAFGAASSGPSTWPAGWSRRPCRSTTCSSSSSS